MKIKERDNLFERTFDQFLAKNPRIESFFMNKELSTIIGFLFFGVSCCSYLCIGFFPTDLVKTVNLPIPFLGIPVIIYSSRFMSDYNTATRLLNDFKDNKKLEVTIGTLGGIKTFNTIEYVMRSSPKFIIRKIIRENPHLMISVLKAMRTNDIPIHGRGGMFNKVFLPEDILQDGILLGDIEILGF